MMIKTTYIGTLNGVHGVWCGFKPEGAIITKEIPVLYPDPEHKLRKKDTEELLDYVILKDGDSPDNYEEVEIEKPEEPKEEPKDAE